jgi:hypothetical protein
MPGESFRLLPVDEDLQPPNQIHIGPKRLGNGIRNQLFTQNSRRRSCRQVIRKICDARAVWLDVEP